ncbi:unnamed protein product [Amoebophrya sp. A25]|nr:unnamed protein product [Amoebophrya sp. A25]|eukprot:GSA25T00006985001.1
MSLLCDTCWSDRKGERPVYRGTYPPQADAWRTSYSVIVIMCVSFTKETERWTSSVSSLQRIYRTLVR